MAAERKNVRASWIRRAALPVLAGAITVVILPLYAGDSTSHVDNRSLSPLDASGCYTAEDSLFLCHAAAAMASTLDNNSTSSNMSDHASKESLMQGARSEQLYGEGSTPMTSRVMTGVEMFLYPRTVTPNAPRERAPTPSCHPMAGDAMAMWDDLWHVMLRREIQRLSTPTTMDLDPRHMRWASTAKMWLTSGLGKTSDWVCWMLGSDTIRCQGGAPKAWLTSVLNKIESWVRGAVHQVLHAMDHEKISSAAKNGRTWLTESGGTLLTRASRYLMEVKDEYCSSGIWQAITQPCGGLRNTTMGNGPGSDREIACKGQITDKIEPSPPGKKGSWWTSPIGGRGDRPGADSVSHHLEYGPWY